MFQRYTLVMVIAVMIGFGIYAETQRREAVRQAGLNTAPLLATQAYLLNWQAPWLSNRSILLALEAYSRAPTLENGSILRRVSKMTPQLLVSIPHENAVAAIAFDHEGSLLYVRGDGSLFRMPSGENNSELFSQLNGRKIHEIIVRSDGSRLATGAYKYGEALLWNIDTDEQPVLIKRSHRLGRLTFSPTGHSVVTNYYEYPAAVWSVDTGELLYETEPEIGVVAAAIGRGDNLLITAGRDSVVRISDIATGQELFHAQLDAFTVAISADGNIVSAGSQKGIIRVWSTLDGSEFPTRKLQRRAEMLTFGPENRLLASTSDTVHLWSADNSREPTVINVDGLRETRLSANGLVATVDAKSIVQIWDSFSGRELAMFALEERAQSIAFDDSGQLLAISTQSGLVTVRDLGPLTAVRHAGAVTDLAFSPDGLQLASSSRDRTTRVWDIATSSQLKEFDHGELVESVEFSPDGQWLAAGDRGGMAPVWATEDFAERLRLAHIGEVVMFGVHALAISPDSSVLATGGSDGRARLWAIDYGLPRQALENGATILSIAFSPDGKQLATGDTSKVRIWDVDSLSQLQEFPHQCNVFDVEFDPSGDLLATACSDDRVRLWEIDTGQVILEFRHDDYVRAVAFSPNGKRIASTGGDRTARIWEMEAGREIARILLDDDGYAVDFSPDGRQLATGGRGGLIRIWPVSQNDLISDVCSRLPRLLSEEEESMYLAGSTPERPCSK